MKYAIVTFGCRVNQADSLGVERQLRARGGRAVSVDEADLVVVNTCSVTGTADQGARQTIRRIARTNPTARIVATGCYATRAAADLSALPGVALVVPNTDKERLATRLELEPLLTTAGRFGSGDGACGETIRPRDGWPHQLHPSRANWVRPDLCVLHHSDDQRRWAQPADRPDRWRNRPGLDRGVQGGHRDRRAPWILRA